MINLSTRVTGDRLLASEWDNHSKEKENVVTMSGGTLDTTTTQLFNAVDTVARSNFFVANSGATPNVYTVQSRAKVTSLAPLANGMLMNIKFETKNSGNCTINFGTGAKTLKNSDGGTLDGYYIKAGEVIPFYFDGGSNMIATKKLYKNISDDDTFEIILTTHAAISPYIEYDTSGGTTPTYVKLLIRGVKSGNILTSTIVLEVRNDGITQSSTLNSGVIKIKLTQAIIDRYGINIESIQYQGATAVVEPLIGHSSVVGFYAPIRATYWKNDGSGNSNKIIISSSKHQYQGSGINTVTWNLGLSLVSEIKDV